MGRPGLLDVVIWKASRPQNISDVHFWQSSLLWGTLSESLNKMSHRRTYRWFLIFQWFEKVDTCFLVSLQHKTGMWHGNGSWFREQCQTGLGIINYQHKYFSCVKFVSMRLATVAEVYIFEVRVFDISAPSWISKLLPLCSPDHVGNGISVPAAVHLDHLRSTRGLNIRARSA